MMYKYLIICVSLLLFVSCGKNEIIPTTQPVTSGSFYVSTNGDDANDGLSQSTPLKTIQLALNKVEPGNTVYVKAWEYLDQKITFPKSWEEGKYISLEWYTKTPGDVTTVKDFNHLSAHDTSLMPLIKWSDRTKDTWILIESKNYIKIKNIQITEYKVGMKVSSGNNNIFENILMSKFWDVNAKYDGRGVYMIGTSSNNLLQDVTVVNSAAEGFFILWDKNILDSVRVYSNDNSTGVKSATDYYVVLRGATNSIVRNSYIERVWDLDHNGHGFTIKWDNEGNLIHNNLSRNLNNGWFVARHRGTKNNIFRDNEVIWGSIGIMARDGANYNTFENIKITGARDSVVFLDSTEDGGKRSGGKYNLFKNIEINDTGRVVFSFNGNTYADTISVGNVFDNITIKWAPHLLEAAHISEWNTLQNSSIEDVEKYISFRKGIDESDFEFMIKDTSKKNTWF